MSTPIYNQELVNIEQNSVKEYNNLVGMVNETPGKQLYQHQVECLITRDVDRLIDGNYQDDAILITSSSTVKGKPALKEHFKTDLDHVNIIQVQSADAFVESGDTTLFEATIETDAGTAKVYDAFVLHNGKVAYHFTGVK
jgi:ketosteroid isomerase-like protein